MPTEKLDEELSVATNFKSEAEGRKMLLARKMFLQAYSNELLINKSTNLYFKL